MKPLGIFNGFLFEYIIPFKMFFTILAKNVMLHFFVSLTNHILFSVSLQTHKLFCVTVRKAFKVF